jgi:UDP-N-acetylmuramate--alanine ligase
MPGMHNVLNALAVIAVCDELEVPRTSPAALASSGRAAALHHRRRDVGRSSAGRHDRRRLRPPPGRGAGHARGRAARVRAALVVAFQPHRYTRTQFCFEELTRAFNRADVLLLADVYAAGEQPIAGATSEALAQAIRAHGHRDVTWVGPRAEVAKAIADRAQPGDIVITLGAGDITRVGPELLSMLNAKAEAAP